jgi:hypothetical protein
LEPIRFLDYFLGLLFITPLGQHGLVEGEGLAGLIGAIIRGVHTEALEMAIGLLLGTLGVGLIIGEPTVPALMGSLRRSGVGRVKLGSYHCGWVLGLGYREQLDLTARFILESPSLQHWLYFLILFGFELLHLGSVPRSHGSHGCSLRVDSDDVLVVLLTQIEVSSQVIDGGQRLRHLHLWRMRGVAVVLLESPHSILFLFVFERPNGVAISIHRLAGQSVSVAINGLRYDILLLLQILAIVHSLHLLERVEQPLAVLERHIGGLIDVGLEIVAPVHKNVIEGVLRGKNRVLLYIITDTSHLPWSLAVVADWRGHILVHDAVSLRLLLVGEVQLLVNPQSPQLILILLKTDELFVAHLRGVGQIKNISLASLELLIVPLGPSRLIEVIDVVS